MHKGKQQNLMENKIDLLDIEQSNHSYYVQAQ